MALFSLHWEIPNWHSDRYLQLHLTKPKIQFALLNIHLSIHSFPLIFIRVEPRLEPIPAITGWEAGVHLVCRKANTERETTIYTHIHTIGNLELPISLDKLHESGFIHWLLWNKMWICGSLWSLHTLWSLHIPRDFGQVKLGALIQVNISKFSNCQLTGWQLTRLCWR